MRRDFVTVVWVTDPATTDVPEPGDAGSVEVAAVNNSELEIAVRFGRTRGGVVVVGADASLERARSFGADEVISLDSARESLDATIRSARARASTRLTRAATTQELGALALIEAATGLGVGGDNLDTDAEYALLDAALPRLANIAVPALGYIDDADSSADVRRLLSIVNAETLREVQLLQGDLFGAVHTLAAVVGRAMGCERPGDPDLCDLRSVVAELATVVRREVSRAGVFVVELPDRPCVVPMSAPRAVGMICALLNNAVAAMPALTSREGVIGLRVLRESSLALVEVTDNGVGMSSEVRCKALNPFFTTRRPHALGLGLTLAASSVRRAGGEIMIDSEPTLGTNVRLFLPLACESDSTDSGPQPGGVLVH